MAASRAVRAPELAAEACAAFHLDPRKVTALRKAMLGIPSVAALAETFKVLGDVTRVRILDALSRSELCVCDLAQLHRAERVGRVASAPHLARDAPGASPARRANGVLSLDDQHIVRLFEQGMEHVEERGGNEP